MAFPAIESQNPTADNATGGATTSGNTAAAAHSVVLPATVSAGSLLVILGRVSIGTAAITVTGGGWTIVQDNSDAADDRTFYMWRDTLADGSEGGTSVEINHTSSKMTAVALSITGAADPADQTPENSTVAVGTGTTIGPTTCTPTGGAKDYLWLWFAGLDGEATLNKTAVTDYTSGDVDASTGTGGLPATNSQIKFGSRQLNAASQDPGDATATAVQAGWSAWCIAIHPPAAAPIQKAGAGILDLSGGGVGQKQLPPQTYEKAGMGRMGVQQPFTYTKAGIAVSERVASGAEAGVFTDTGTGVLAAAAAGTRARDRTRAGAGILTGSGAGAEAGLFVDSGVGVTERVGSGASQKVTPGGQTYEKNGGGTLELTAAGSRAVVSSVAGAGVVDMAASGPKTLAGGATYEKAGAGILTAAGSATDDQLFVEKGTGSVGFAAQGAEQAVFTESGAGVLDAKAGGTGTKATFNTWVKAGAGAINLAGSASEAAVFAESGTGILTGAGSATDAQTFFEKGAGILTGVGSGFKTLTQGVEYVKTGAGVSARAAQGPKVRLLQRYGTAIAVFSAQGRDEAAWAKRGTGILDFSGTGDFTPLVIPGAVTVSDNGQTVLDVVVADRAAVALQARTGADVAVVAKLP